MRGFAENLPAVEDALARMAGARSQFVGSLAAGRSLPQPGAPVIADAMARYQE